MYYCAISLPDSTHLCSPLIQTATDTHKKKKSFSVPSHLFMSADFSVF